MTAGEEFLWKKRTGAKWGPVTGNRIPPAKYDKLPLFQSPSKYNPPKYTPRRIIRRPPPKLETNKNEQTKTIDKPLSRGGRLTYNILPDGSIHGLYITTYPNGATETSIEYSYGHPITPKTTYSPNGKILRMEYYDENDYVNVTGKKNFAHNILYFEDYDESGNIIE